MQYLIQNYPEIIVGDVVPLAREILKMSNRLASEITSKNSSCTVEEYLIHLTNATNILSMLVAHNLNMDGQNV